MFFIRNSLNSVSVLLPSLGTKLTQLLTLEGSEVVTKYSLTFKNQFKKIIKILEVLYKKFLAFQR